MGDTAKENIEETEGQRKKPAVEADQQGEQAPAELAGAEPALGEAAGMTREEAAGLLQEKEELYDRLLRTQADFDNYRKRVQKEQANLLRYGAENALREVVPVLDNLERAVDSARKHSDTNSRIREGIELILSQMQEVLGRLGVRPVETVGHPFDPNKHEALIRVHAPDVPEGDIVDEIRKGYYLHDKILRPAQVTVGTHEKVRDL